MDNPSDHGEITPHMLGKSGEEVALRYLKRKKYRILETRFRLFRGEIDIIAFHQKTLVFVEVKTRKSRDFGLPEEAVTPAKQKQIRKIAQGFLAVRKMPQVECQFDVISLMKTGENKYSIRHIKNAF